MRNQQEAEKAEQQRIKNLVLNYDLQDAADQDGIDNNLYSLYFSQSNPNFPKHRVIPRSTLAHENISQGLVGGDKHTVPHHQHNASLHQQSASHVNARPADKSGTNRSGQRARKLQLSDVDWYDQKSSSTGGGRGRGRFRRTVG